MDKRSDSKVLDPQRVRGWFDTYLEHRCICQYCGFDGSRSPEDWVQLQGDHLIPRHLAVEHAEDALNRVTACYYCNSIKRRFDPSHGNLVKVSSIEIQQELIESARQEIQKRKEKLWRYGGGLQSSFDFMMSRFPRR